MTPQTTSSTSRDQPKERKPLRLWPGVVAVVILFAARFGLKAAIPGFDGFSKGMMGSFYAAAAILLWWLFASRAAWVERLAALVLLPASLFAAMQLAHGSMGPLWLVGYALPGLMLAFVAWAVLTRDLPDRARRVTMVATILLASGVWTLFRTDGIDGDHAAQFGWRFAASPEERLMAGVRTGAEAASATAPVDRVAALDGEASAAEWPGFRGPTRDGRAPAVRIATDWTATPPVELWRRPVGPGWSSFAVDGDLFYTQEQWGEEERVSCYRASTGEPVWHHRDAVRFFESNAGAGPRGTPTLHGGRVYALGATGILNVLDAADGSPVWTRDAASDAEINLPVWGFASSPLVTDDQVVVALSGRLVAYGLEGGEPRWLAEDGGESYSSPHLATAGGVAQILLPTGDGLSSVAPADGAVLWQHEWPGFPMVQPAVLEDGGILVVASQRSGMRRLAPEPEAGGWRVEERWTSRGLKPYFNDFVVHRSHAYGFDGRILASIELETGERAWKGGRYGSGQLVLLPEQDLLLVLSERGELALVAAEPGAFEELARVPAIEGKTWNHPVLVGDRLFVRNASEMSAFRLPTASG
ncbi:MAG: PQQ-like beta-propeller repeat protein [Holophagales bacterium]|nr:PQQ-like beta-propeller repeat protein [Holophagales bacterium]